jgi:hypothetical protein
MAASLNPPTANKAGNLLLPGVGETKAEQKRGVPALLAKVHHRVGLEALHAGRAGRQAGRRPAPRRKLAS